MTPPAHGSLSGTAPNLIYTPNAGSDLAKWDEVKRTGIYCLVGPDPEKPILEKVYIGEADKVITRLTLPVIGGEKTLGARRNSIDNNASGCGCSEQGTVAQIILATNIRQTIRWLVESWREKIGMVED